MALWKWTGTNFEKCAWYSTNMHNLKAMIYGCASSLKEAPVNPKGYLRIVQNMGYKVIEPHIWIGMDEPEWFGPEFSEMPYRKVWRGNYAGNLVANIPAKEYPEMYFMDVVKQDRHELFYRKGLDCQFVWVGNTMVAAIHLALWMGFKTIGFAGIDLQGMYFDDKDSTLTEQEKINTKRLLEEEFEFMTWLVGCGRATGITFENYSKTSRLSEIMPTIKL